mmetsp:Transcript_19492/g.28307  ORF Transcript_19492/g.28307 Transcript_19492/m.28307 type:complete len:161 (+) Transcript_19492:547-1029(+)
MDVNTEIGMPTPSTPGVWSVSHQDLQKLGGEEDLSSATIDTGQIVTEVYFCWTVDANSAFVTGEFNNWEVTLPMEKVNTRDGEVWIASKMLPPGSFQYKCKYIHRESKNASGELDARFLGYESHGYEDMGTNHFLLAQLSLITTGDMRKTSQSCMMNEGS